VSQIKKSKYVNEAEKTMENYIYFALLTLKVRSITPFSMDSTSSFAKYMAI
jgi:hypothetical protein